MSFNQTRDLLDVARQFHLNLTELYGKMLEHDWRSGRFVFPSYLKGAKF